MEVISVNIGDKIVILFFFKIMVAVKNVFPWVEENSVFFEVYFRCIGSGIYICNMCV